MARRSRAGERAARWSRRPARGRGFTYIGLMIAIVLIGAALAAVGELWATEAARQRETELLWRGDAIRAAITAYVLAAPGGGWQYPQRLEDLVKDPRFPQVRRYLRRVYADPITGEADWTLIRAPDGGIMGVASASQARPIKRMNFEPIDSSFEKTTCYCDWQFLFAIRGRAPLPPH